MQYTLQITKHRYQASISPAGYSPNTLHWQLTWLNITQSSDRRKAKTTRHARTAMVSHDRQVLFGNPTKTDEVFTQSPKQLLSQATQHNTQESRSSQCRRCVSCQWTASPRTYLEAPVQTSQCCGLPDGPRPASARNTLKIIKWKHQHSTIQTTYELQG